MGLQGGGINNAGNLTLQNCTLSGNTSTNGGGGGGSGGAIYSSGPLTLRSCTLSGNSALAFGGGIAQFSGTLSVQNSTLTGNAGAYGGAIYDHAATVTVQYSTLTGSSVRIGGAIDNRSGTVTVQNSTLKSNSAAYGGAISNDNSGTVTVEYSSLSGNYGGFGGAIYNKSNSTVTVQFSSLSGNSARGGGAISSAGSVTVTNSDLSNDTATIGGALNNGTGALMTVSNSTLSGDSGFEAGAIANAGTLTIQNCSLTNNTSSHEGGAIGNGGTLLVQNSTLSGNSAATTGGAIAVNSGSVTVQNSTLSGNTAFNGGGISGNATLTNTLIAGNTATASFPSPDFSGTVNFAASYNNLIGNKAGVTGIATGDGHGNQVGVPNAVTFLGALQSNGGLLVGAPGSTTPLLTIALLPGSSAIDTGSNSHVPTGLTYDERGPGYNRIVDGTVDIGAFEVQQSGTTTTVVSSLAPSQDGQDVTFTATVASSDAPSGSLTGSVTFFADSATLGTVTLVNGSASIDTSSLSVGSHTITAQYSGCILGNLTLIGSTGALTQFVNASPPPTPPTPPSSSGSGAGNGGGSSGGNSGQSTAKVCYVATGADAGGGPTVNVYNAATGAETTSFNAFPASFAGGVRVAVADVNGDGTPDVICGAGPGGGPEVRVFDGKTFQMIMDFQALPPQFAGGVFVAAGDVNGDGFADVITAADAGGGPQVTITSGKTGQQLSSFYATAPQFTGGIRVAAADLNGDGFADVIAAAGPGGGPQVTIFDGKSLSLLTAFYALPSAFTGGMYVAAGDVNGDGKADIIVGAEKGGGPEVNVFNGATIGFNSPAPPSLYAFYALPSQFTGGVRVGYSSDYKGHASILSVAGPGGGPQTTVFDGLTQAELDSFYAFPSTFGGGVYVGGN